VTLFTYLSPFSITESLLSLTDRLTGPFNIEQIVLQLDISISDAIMNFQDSGFKVNKQTNNRELYPRKASGK